MDTVNLTPLETMTFTYNANTGVGGETIVMAQDFQDGAQLCNAAFMFQRFLTACGYTYVENVTITTNDGAEFFASNA